MVGEIPILWPTGLGPFHKSHGEVGDLYIPSVCKHKIKTISATVAKVQEWASL